MDHLPIPALHDPRVRAAMHDALAALERAESLAGEEGEGPGLEAAMEEWWAAYERALSGVLPTLPVTCGSPCAACCADNPRGVTGVELERLARAVRARPDANQLEAAVLGAAGKFQAEVDALGLPQAHQRTRREGPSCPLLDGSGRCSVYAARPVACRMFFAFTPPAWCSGHHPRHHEAFNPHIEPPERARELLLAISERLGLGGVPMDLRRGLAARLQRQD